MILAKDILKGVKKVEDVDAAVLKECANISSAKIPIDPPRLEKEQRYTLPKGWNPLRLLQ